MEVHLGQCDADDPPHEDATAHTEARNGVRRKAPLLPSVGTVRGVGSHWGSHRKVVRSEVRTLSQNISASYTEQT
jgi:hypothetical protein